MGRSGRLLLALARTVILGSGSHGTHGHIFLSHDSWSRATNSGLNGCRFTSSPSTLLHGVALLQWDFSLFYVLYLQLGIIVVHRYRWNTSKRLSLKVI
jgi:hypothetical protein